jgi:hypothetical protein
MPWSRTLPIRCSPMGRAVSIGEPQAHKILHFMENSPDEDWSARSIAETLAMSPSSAAVCLGYLTAYRAECQVVRRGTYRWSPLDDHYDRRLQARELAEEITPHLDPPWSSPG